MAMVGRLRVKYFGNTREEARWKGTTSSAVLTIKLWMQRLSASLSDAMPRKVFRTKRPFWKCRTEWEKSVCEAERSERFEHARIIHETSSPRTVSRNNDAHNLRRSRFRSMSRLKHSKWTQMRIRCDSRWNDPWFWIKNILVTAFYKIRIYCIVR